MKGLAGSTADEPVLVPPSKPGVAQVRYTPTYNRTPHPWEHRPPGTVEHQLDERTRWQHCGRAGARPSQQAWRSAGALHPDLHRKAHPLGSTLAGDGPPPAS